VVYDADCLVNLGESAKGRPRAELELERRFLTASGRKRAEELLLSA
jgi:hypothetical protein